MGNSYFHHEISHQRNNNRSIKQKKKAISCRFESTNFLQFWNYQTYNYRNKETGFYEFLTLQGRLTS